SCLPRHRQTHARCGDGLGPPFRGDIPPSASPLPYLRTRSDREREVLSTLLPGTAPKRQWSGRAARSPTTGHDTSWFPFLVSPADHQSTPSFVNLKNCSGETGADPNHLPIAQGRLQWRPSRLLIPVHLPLWAIALCVDRKGLLDHFVGAAE